MGLRRECFGVPSALRSESAASDEIESMSLRGSTKDFLGVTIDKISFSFSASLVSVGAAGVTKSSGA